MSSQREFLFAPRTIDFFQNIVTYLYIGDNIWCRWWAMKKTMSVVFDDNDNKAVDLFVDLGMPRNLAKTLLYVSQVNECRSADVEHGANLRQPEVSLAMQELQRRGWVSKRDLKKEKGKGRPIHIYKAMVSLDNIVEQFEQEKTKEFEKIKHNMYELKTLLD